MLLSKNYHEEEYDGIVLKIPSWFIGMNNLEPVLKKLTSGLSECRLSVMHPDHLRNLYELGNYSGKKEKIQEGKRRDEEAKAQHRKIFDDRISMNTIYLMWKPYPIVFDDYYFHVGDTKYTLDDVFTKKLSISSKFAKHFWEVVNTEEKFLEFVSISGCGLKSYVFDWIGTTMLCHRGGLSLQFNVPVLYAEWDVKPQGKVYGAGYTYRPRVVELTKDGIYRIENEVLEGYERNGMKLIKTK